MLKISVEICACNYKSRECIRTEKNIFRFHLQTSVTKFNNIECDWTTRT